jgi:ABC-type bacteriocin/lantibiotic exporter with double-glycine peptidase domain
MGLEELIDLLELFDSIDLDDVQKMEVFNTVVLLEHHCTTFCGDYQDVLHLLDIDSRTEKSGLACTMSAIDEKVQVPTMDTFFPLH